MKTEIQKLIDEFRARGWKSNPYDLTCRLIGSNSEHVLTLVEMVLEHHCKVGFQEELRALLKRHEIEWDEKYVWD